LAAIAEDDKDGKSSSELGYAGVSLVLQAANDVAILFIEK